MTDKLTELEELLTDDPATPSWVVDYYTNPAYQDLVYKENPFLALVPKNESPDELTSYIP